MAKYIVETYYTCTFKVKHHLEDISNNQLDTLDNRDDGEYEILDVKFDKRNTKNLEKKSDKVEINYNESIEKLDKNQNPIPKNIVLNNTFKESITKRYEIGRMKIDKLLTLGYTTSADPRKIGTK